MYVVTFARFKLTLNFAEKIARLIVY